MGVDKEVRIFARLIMLRTGLSANEAVRLYITNGYNYSRAICKYMGGSK